MESFIESLSLNISIESLSDTEDSIVDFSGISHQTFTLQHTCFVWKQEPHCYDKSLMALGYRINEISDWDIMDQPIKPDLYMILENTISKHILPSIKIWIGNTHFNCHTIVLQCYSEYFIDYERWAEIRLPSTQISPGGLVMAYDWMLADKPEVPLEGILELFSAANFLRIQPLIDQCWCCLENDKFIREEVAYMLFLETHKLELDSLYNLRPLLLARICKYFLTVVASKEFVSMNAEDMCAFIGSNAIGANSELEIFFAVVRWICHDWKTRKTEMIKVLKCVRFGLIPPWYLAVLNTGNTDHYYIDRIVVIPQVKNLVTDGILYITMKIKYGCYENIDFPPLMDMFKQVTPTQRQWVYDKDCNYHHHLDCSSLRDLTYESFIAYLEMKQTLDRNNWTTLLLETDKNCLLHPCCELYSFKRKESISVKKVYANTSGISVNMSTKSTATDDAIF